MSLRAHPRVALLLALACVLAVRASAQTNLVTNPVFADAGYDWTLAPAAVDSLLIYGDPYGTTAAEFGAYDPGFYDTISQTLTTQPGYTYTLTFELGLTSDPQYNTYSDFEAIWNGTTVINVPGTDVTYYPEPEPFSITVDATSTSSVLSFAGYNDAGFFYLTQTAVVVDGPTDVPEGGSTLLYLGVGIATCSAAIFLKSRQRFAS